MNVYYRKLVAALEKLPDYSVLYYQRGMDYFTHAYEWGLLDSAFFKTYKDLDTLLVKIEDNSYDMFHMAEGIRSTNMFKAALEEAPEADTLQRTEDFF